MCHLYFWTIVNSYEGANTLIHWQLELSLRGGGEKHANIHKNLIRFCELLISEKKMKKWNGNEKL